MPEGNEVDVDKLAQSVIEAMNRYDADALLALVDPEIGEAFVSQDTVLGADPVRAQRPGEVERLMSSRPSRTWR